MELDSQIVKNQVMAALFDEVQPPPRIGRFTLLEREAVGSMGEVYVAYDEKLDRRVAIKLLRPEPSVDAADETARHDLLCEARTLAGMPHHRNLVQVYDAGLHGDRVFLAMEYIHGRTLRDWMAGPHDALPRKGSREIRWRVVLDVVLEAGRGLAAAHTAGVVHRDFKPENVVVSDEGRVCVIDFGVARSSPSAPAGGRAATTGTGQSVESIADANPPLAGATGNAELVGTPAYMAPEQLRGESSDARSDQFSFSVVLYEALYGVRPFAGEDIVDLCAQVTAGRHAVPPRDASVPRRIWTVLERGLSVDPAGRHDSMRALLSALSRDPAKQRRRYLSAGLLLCTGVVLGIVALSTATSSDPCALAGSAVASTWNATVAALGGAAFDASGVRYAGPTWQIVRPRLERYAAELAAEHRTTCVASVRHEQSGDLVSRKMLCLGRRERALAALVAELVKADGITVPHAIESVAGLPRIETCRNDELLMAGVAPPEDPRIAAVVKQVRAQIAEAHAQQSLRRREVRTLAEAALAAAKSIDYPPVLAEALYQAGSVWRLGPVAADIARAEEALLDAADLAESQRNDELLAEIWLELLRLADFHHGKQAVGHQYARRALAASERMHDERSRMIGVGLLGSLYRQAGDYAKAEELQNTALQLADKSGASGLARADIWNRLGVLDEARGHFAQARSAYEKALELTRSELGDDHPRIADLSYNFAILCRRVGELARARELQRAALRIWAQAQGPITLDAADSHLELALVEIETGDLERAGEHARAAGNVLAEVAPEGSAMASVEIRLGMIAFRQARFDAALQAFERGLAIRERTGASRAQIAVAASNVGEVLVELGRAGEALARVEQAERALAGAPDASLTLKAALDKVGGLALLAKGDARAALPRLERALALLEQQPGVSLEEADLKWAIARALSQGGAAQGRRVCRLAEAARSRYDELGTAGSRASERIRRWQGSTRCVRHN